MQSENFYTQLYPFDSFSIITDNNYDNDDIIIDNTLDDNNGLLIDYTLEPSIFKSQDYNDNLNIIDVFNPINGYSNTSPSSTISSFDSIDNSNTFSPELNDYNYYSDNNPTINTNDLTKFNKYQNSPILKSQNFKNLLIDNINNNDNIININKYISSIQIVEGGEREVDLIVGKEGEAEDGDDEGDDEEEEDDDEDTDSSIDNDSHKQINVKSNKKISDSRLSLAQLSIVLNLNNNIEETAKREKNILKILKDDLNFPIGEKTWIRDTPSTERERLMNSLTEKVELVYNYGYSKKTLSIIVRRASYYLMQGRLRRERRLRKKHSNLATKKNAIILSTTDS